MNHPIVLGITGASGAIYAVRLLEVLARVAAMCICRLAHPAAMSSSTN